MGLLDFLKGKGGRRHEEYGDDAFAMYGITGVSPIDGQPIEPAEGDAAGLGVTDAGAGADGGASS